MNFSKTNSKTEGTKYKYMIIATLPPGTKCLFYPPESEILLSSNTQLKILEKVENSDHEAVNQVEFIPPNQTTLSYV